MNQDQENLLYKATKSTGEGILITDEGEYTCPGIMFQDAIWVGYQEFLLLVNIWLVLG